MRYLESCEVRFIETESRMVAARGWGGGGKQGAGAGGNDSLIGTEC